MEPVGAASIVTKTVSGKSGTKRLLSGMVSIEAATGWLLLAAPSPFALFLLSIALGGAGRGVWSYLGRFISSEHAGARWVAGLLLSPAVYGIGEEAGWRGSALSRL